MTGGYSHTITPRLLTGICIEENVMLSKKKSFLMKRKSNKQHNLPASPSGGIFETQNYRCVMTCSHTRKKSSNQPMLQAKIISRPLIYNPLFGSYEAEWDQLGGVSDFRVRIDDDASIHVQLQIVYMDEIVCAELGNTGIRVEDSTLDEQDPLGNQLLFKVIAAQESTKKVASKRLAKELKKGKTIRSFHLNDDANLSVSVCIAGMEKTIEEYLEMHRCKSSRADSKSERYLRHLDNLSKRTTTLQGEMSVLTTSDTLSTYDKNEQEKLSPNETSTCEEINPVAPASTMENIMTFLLDVNPCQPIFTGTSAPKVEQTQGYSNKISTS